MGLTLSFPPGFADISDSVLAAGQPALSVDLASIYSNGVFSLARTEVFSGTYKNGDTVPLPVSPTDGYVYQRNELLYFWTIRNSTDPSTLWISQQDSLFYGAWLVDQATGQVFSDEWYAVSGSHANVAHSNDGLLQVWTVAQRGLTDVILAAVPSYAAITASWLSATDKALQQQLIQGLNDDAKFAVLNHEVFYLGEYYNGQTVALPTSPADGYTYSAAECKFLFSWRWTAIGNSAVLEAPPVGYGQMGPIKASVNGSGVVSVSVAMIDGSGNLNTFTTLGRISVFAFCQRSGTPGTITPTANQFAEVDFGDFMPGSPLPYTILQQIENNILQGLLTPEFFGPTTHANGDTIALPVSPIDGYTYARSELQYLWSWSDTTNQTGSNLRLPLFFGSINESTGVVTLHTWRLPPGGPYVDDDDALCRISVIVVARRMAEAPVVTAVPSTSAPSGATTTGGNVVADVPTLSVGVPEVPTGAINSSNNSFTTSTAYKFVEVFWNGQQRHDFTLSGTTLTTTFVPDTGDDLYIVGFD